MTAPVENPEVIEDDDLEENEGQETEETNEESDDPTVLKAEKERLQSALDKERQKTARLKARLGGQGKPRGDAPEGDDAENIRAQVRAEANKEIIVTKAEAKLAARGVKNPERLVRLANLDNVERLDDGTIDGLEDALDELEEDYPEFFETSAAAPATTTRPRANGSADGARRGAPPKKPVDAFDAFAEARFGKRR